MFFGVASVALIAFTLLFIALGRIKAQAPAGRRH